VHDSLSLLSYKSLLVDFCTLWQMMFLVDVYFIEARCHLWCTWQKDRQTRT